MKFQKVICVFLFLSSATLSLAQEFADKNYYLIDSLKLENLSDETRTLIDTNLDSYHATTNDTAKLNYIGYIVEECWDDNVWPKYNLYLNKVVKQRLTSSSLTSSLKRKYLTFLAGSINNIGFLEEQQGKTIDALKSFHLGLRINEKLGNKIQIASALNNLGYVYRHQGDVESALKYYNKSQQIQEEIGDKKGLATTLSNIGVLYDEQKNYLKASEYALKSLEIRKEINDKKGLATNYNNLGKLNMQLGNFNDALNYFLKSKPLYEDLGDNDGLSICLSNIGTLYYEQKMYAKAEQYSISSLQLAKKSNFPSNVMGPANTLDSINRRKGNYKKALEHYELFIQMRDSVRNKETEKAAIKQQAKYEIEKVEQEKELLAKEKDIQSLKLNRNRILTISFSVAFGLTSILVIAIFRGYRKKQVLNELLEKQKSLVEKKNQKITDSITYAQYIQEAILPPEKLIKKWFPKSFVLYKPKDIVSGDFYWLEVVNDNVFFAAADCTGHGVPGALVSMVCYDSLNRAVRQFGLTNPGKVLDKVRELVIESFEKSERKVNDGMDIALCYLNKKTNVLYYSGAQNPIWIVNPNRNEWSGDDIILDEDLKGIEIKADKQPIGIFLNPKPFTSHKIKLEKGDKIYIFSDGYADQFGGEDGKKFKTKPLKIMLASLYEKSMEEQHVFINEHFEKWKINEDQIDDVCMIGIEV